MRKYLGEQLVAIMCNQCGNTVDTLNHTPREWDIASAPYKEVRLRYGYGSELFDLYEISFDLCECCVRELIDGFKVKADVREYDWLDGTLGSKGGKIRKVSGKGKIE